LTIEAVLIHASFVNLRVMVGYRALDLGADVAFIGLMAAAIAVPGLVAGISMGHLAGRIGGARMMLGGTALFGIGISAMLLVDGLWILPAAAVIAGIGYLAVHVGQLTFVALRSVGRPADQNFATLAVGASLGQLVGPPTLAGVIAVLASTEWTASIPDSVVGLATSFVFAGFALLFVRPLRRVELSSQTPATKPTTEASGRRVSMYSSPGFWRSLIVSSSILVTIDLSYAFIPVWATERDVSVTVIAWLLATRALVSLLSRVGLGRLVARFGRKPLLLVTMSIGVVALTLFPLTSVWGALLVMIALGFTLGIPQPLTLAWVVAITRPADHGAAMGFRVTTNRLIQVTIPLLVGAFAAPFGAAGIFWSNALLVAGATVVTARSDPDVGRGARPPP